MHKESPVNEKKLDVVKMRMLQGTCGVMREYRLSNTRRWGTVNVGEASKIGTIGKIHMVWERYEERWREGREVSTGGGNTGNKKDGKTPDEMERLYSSRYGGKTANNSMTGDRNHWKRRPGKIMG